MRSARLNFDSMKKLLLFVFIVLVFGLTGCTGTRYITVETVMRDTVWENHTVRDSIFVEQHDSIVLHTKGDTVTVDRWHYRDRWRDRLKTDTVYISKRDTVIQAGEPLDTGDRLSWWDKVRIWIGNIVLLAVFATEAIWFHKVLKK